MNNPTPDNLVDALPCEIERVQKIIAICEEESASPLAVALMKLDINAAHQAMAEGDVIKMIVAYIALKVYEL